MLADLGDDIAFAQARLGGGRIGLNFLDDQAALIVLLDRGAEIAGVAGGARQRLRRRATPPGSAGCRRPARLRARRPAGSYRTPSSCDSRSKDTRCRPA